MNIKDFILDIPEIDGFQEIIYFGGSFNPWHDGHSECLKKAPKEALKIIIPDHNPQKELLERELSIPATDGLNDNIFIYDTFFQENKKNPTASWFIPLVQELPSLKHSLLMGYDSYTKLETWVDFESLLKNIHKIYVLNRLNNKLDLKYGNTVFLGPHEHEALSSTELRKQ